MHAIDILLFKFKTLHACIVSIIPNPQNMVLPGNIDNIINPIIPPNIVPIILFNPMDKEPLTVSCIESKQATAELLGFCTIKGLKIAHIVTDIPVLTVLIPIFFTLLHPLP